MALGAGQGPELGADHPALGIRGAIITAVDLLRGLGIYAGLDVLRVPGVTGYYDTDYEAKGRYAVEALEEGFDFVLVHVEAPDEAGHQGDIAEKVKAIESFDRHVVGTILNRMNSWEDWSVMVLPDHATPICVRTHTEEPVPFAVLSSRNDRGTGGRFSEEEAGRRGLQLEDGRQLLGRFLLGSPRV
jgi:2,3-bisphosphoglycerate-independent phosphoglycerate mutase